MKRKQQILIVLCIAGILTFTSAAKFNSNFFEIAKQIEIFTTLFKELNMNYVDDTNPGELMDGAIKSMLDDLDPYTKFYNEQDVEASRINQAGDYTGIGAKILTKKDKLIVIEPYKNYAADKAGLKAGDQIIKVDNIRVADFKDDAANLLQGSAGTSVEITYLRNGKEESVEISREALEIHAVPYYGMVNDNTGYIVLRKFNRKASSETIEALEALKAEGATKLILDLRGNPGGLLNEAVNVTNIFIPKEQLVVTTKSKVKKYNRTYLTKRDAIDLEIPLVVLIDDRSASASEIVSGALQDMDRAVVIGARSFGKGLVQRPKPVAYGTQMKITISRYYTPSGRCIQALDYWNRDAEGKATRVKKENYNAFKTRNGRTVYDGGGVQPDIELEQTGLSPITKAIVKEQLVFDYATQYYYKNPEVDLGSFALTDRDFKDFKSLIKSSNFDFNTKTEDALAILVDTAEEEDISSDISNSIKALEKELVNYKEKAIDENRNQLISLLTDEIIKRYYYSEGVYDYYTKNNAEVLKAADVLKNTSEYQNILR
ncbi:S41 family peptidase [Winogradskyella aurantiaca]|uniref:S41 family peptidase n=1 Tax=Winogradskyella aurantiaca TaxID=2219558 RepID=UPI000E1CBF42|nr:S41 family peptidase [Winogradskyella aurantiaca]